jgi:hypothetical protein
MINSLLLLVAIVGIFLTRRQLQQDHKVQKATFFKDFYLTMWSDQEIRDFYYEIEYDKFRYSPELLGGSQQEKQLDRFLGFLDLLCDLYSQGSISEREIRFFNYELKKVHDSDHVQAYLQALSRFYSESGVKTKPYSSLVEYWDRTLPRQELPPP